jgi:hypothetical protein
MPVDRAAIERIDYGKSGFKLFIDKRERGAQLPYWFAVAITAICSVMPWVQWKQRFSLRTLLIVITLVAVALGVFATSN